MMFPFSKKWEIKHAFRLKKRQEEKSDERGKSFQRELLVKWFQSFVSEKFEHLDIYLKVDICLYWDLVEQSNWISLEISLEKKN